MGKLWKDWLMAWAIGVTLFGMVLAGGAFAATDMLTRTLFQLFGSPLPLLMDEHHRFAIGLMGAVTMGWGLTYIAAFKALFALEPAKAAPPPKESTTEKPKASPAKPPTKPPASKPAGGEDPYG